MQNGVFRLLGASQSPHGIRTTAHKPHETCCIPAGAGGGGGGLQVQSRGHKRERRGGTRALSSTAGGRHAIRQPFGTLCMSVIPETGRSSQGNVLPSAVRRCGLSSYASPAADGGDGR